MTSSVNDPIAAPSLVLLDVNETLSDTSALAGVLEGVGAPTRLGPLWFASVLRDGFALTATGRPAPFGQVAAAAARSILAGHVPAGSLDSAVDALVSAVGSLPLHPDVPGGLAGLAAGGARLVALTNGSASVASGLLEKGGVRDHLEEVLSVEAFGEGAWKPAAGAYLGACSALGVAPADTLLVAAHLWDVDGAAAAGLRTAYVDREGGAVPGVFAGAGTTVSGFGDLAARLAG